LLTILYVKAAFNNRSLLTSKGHNIVISMNYQDEMQEHNVVRRKALPCPKCKRANLEDRVPRALFVKMFLWYLPLRRYICYRCNRKSYVWHRVEKWGIWRCV